MSYERIRTSKKITLLGTGDAEALLTQAVNVHNQDRVEFHYIYFLPWKNQLVESLDLYGGKVTCIPANNNIQLIFKIGAVVRYIKTHDIQLIHAHLPWAGVVARIAGRLTNVP